MKKHISCSLLFVVMVGLIGCQQLPDFSAGRLASPFTSEVTAGVDPFLENNFQNDFQADLSTPHTGAAPRTFAKRDSSLLAKGNMKPKSKAGRAHISSYAPPVPKSNVQLDRPPTPFQQVGYQASPKSYQPEQNRFTKMMSKKVSIAHPFASSPVQTASYEVPAGKPALFKQAGATENPFVSAPFASKSMKQAHAPQVKLVHVPDNPFGQTEIKEEKSSSSEEDRWRRSGTTSAPSPKKQ